MRLTALAGEPHLIVAIDGQEYGFSELPIGHKAKLQAYIEQKIPHPMEAVKPHLAGLEPDDRRYLLNEARKEAEDWPPDIQSQKGKIVLLSKEGGQIEALFIGLTVHHPSITREEATRLFRCLEREIAFAVMAAKREKTEYNGEGTVQRIYACLFSLILPSDQEGLPRLKVNTGPPSSHSTGGFSSAYASSG